MELITILNHCYHHQGFVYRRPAGLRTRKASNRSPAADGLDRDLLWVPPARTRL